MATLSPYSSRIVRAAKKLILEGITDPSVSEIACVLNRLARPSNPLDEPPELGGEIYHGIRKRMSEVRVHLESVENIPTALLSAEYYRSNFRQHPVENDDDARVCLPASRSPAVGILAIVGDGQTGGKHLILKAWQTYNAKPGSSRLARAITNTSKAYDQGILTGPEADGVVHAAEERLPMTPADLRLKIAADATKGNGKALPSS